MSLQVSVLDEDTRLKQVAIHHRTAFSSQAQFAMDLVRIGFNLETLTSKDFSDKNKIHAFIAPEDLVSRAVRCTELLFQAMEDQGWVTDVPALEDVMIKDDDRKVGYR